jgi:capsular exopolysaccharide synthesis family protein
MTPEDNRQSALQHSQGASLGNSASEEIVLDSQPDQRALNLRPLWRTIQRNLLLIGGIASIAAGANTLLTLSAPKTYEGNFRILVEPSTSQAYATDPSVISRDRVGDIPREGTVDYATLLQVLRSPELLSKIATQIQTRYPDVTASSLQKDLFGKKLEIRQLNTGGDPIRADQGTPAKAIEVLYSGEDPEKVQFILEKMKNVYLQYSLEDRKTRIYGGVQFIDAQLPELSQRVNTLESQLQSLKQRYRLSNPATDSEALATQARELRSQRLQAQRELAEQSTLYSNLQNQLGMSPNEALAASTLSENPRYQVLQSRLKEVETQIAIKAARFNEDSPVLKTLRDQERNLNQLLAEEAAKNLGANSQGVSPNSRVLGFQNSVRLDLIKQLANTTNTAQLLQVRNQALAQTESLLDQQRQQLPAITRQYNEVQRQLEIATQTLNQFSTQREKLRIEGAQKEVPWELIAAPSIAKDVKGNPVPVPSKASRQLLLGLAGGLLLGLIAALLKEKQADVFYCSDDLKEKVDRPLLGEIPFRQGLNQLPAAHDITGMGAFSKAFTSLVTSIRFLSSTSPTHSLVVSSVTVGDGKTTVALYLAQMVASMGQRVLIVDANLRSPSLHTILSLPNTKGVSEVLLNRASIEESIQLSSLEKNLSLLTSGQVSLDAVKLLASAEMQNIMNQVSKAFDFVIYDSPDLLEFSDANFLASHTDGILMVVGLNKTKRSLLNQILQELDQFRLPVLGFVANSPSKTSIQHSNQKPQAELAYDQFNEIRTTSV